MVLDLVWYRIWNSLKVSWRIGNPCYFSRLAQHHSQNWSFSSILGGEHTCSPLISKLPHDGLTDWHQHLIGALALFDDLLKFGLSCKKWPFFTDMSAVNLKRIYSDISSIHSPILKLAPSLRPLQTLMTTTKVNWFHFRSRRRWHFLWTQRNLAVMLTDIVLRQI